MVSINYWVEHQGSRAFVPDTSQMVRAIEGDRAGRPGIEFWGRRAPLRIRLRVRVCAFSLERELRKSYSLF